MNSLLVWILVTSCENPQLILERVPQTSLKQLEDVKQETIIGGFSGGAEGAAAPHFFLYFQNVLRFCFENRFIKCSFILSSETLTLLYFASRIRHNAVSCLSWKVKFPEFSGSAPDSLKIRAQYNVEKFLPGIPGVFHTIVSRGRRIW